MLTPLSKTPGGPETSGPDALPEPEPGAGAILVAAGAQG